MTVEVRLDLFPAEASVASTTYANVRAVIANNNLKLYILTGSGISAIYDMPVIAVDGQPSSGVTVTTADGAVDIEMSGGCGCGSQLKVADLFPGERRVMTPLHP